MKWKAYALAAAVVAVTGSCGTNASDKEKTTTADTVISIADTSTLSTIDSTSTMVADVPATIKASFEKKYPKATNVKWGKYKPAKEKINGESNEGSEIEEENHQVWFHWQGNDHQSRYDKDGDWMGTTNEIKDHSSLPAAVTSTIKNQYPGYTVTSVTREDDKDRIAYEVKLEKGNEKVKTLIGENGQVLKKKIL